MTDVVENPMSPVGAGPEYRERSIWLPQLYLENARAGGHVIQDRVFVDCLLEGPAVIVPVGGCVFDACFMGSHGGDARVLVMEPMAPAQVVGPIPFLNCRFERCRFVGVGFTGDAAFREQVLAVAQGPGSTPEP